MSKNIVITGSSSGIGKTSALYFSQQGWGVAATMRRPEEEEDLQELSGIQLYALDVTQQESIAAAKEKILQDFGSVDVVLNNAGYGLYGIFEAASPEQIQDQFATNVFGLMAVTRSFLPHFRSKHSGMFINVSSIGGLLAFPCVSLYHSTKWALEGFSESLAYELEPLGIVVKIVEPGGIKTDFAGRSLVFAQKEGLKDYNESMDKVMAMFQNPERRAAYSDASVVAQHIFAAASDGTKQLRYLVANDGEKGMIAQRQELGAESFITGMRQRVLGT